MYQTWKQLNTKYPVYLVCRIQNQFATEMQMGNTQFRHENAWYHGTKSRFIHFLIHHQQLCFHPATSL